MNKKLLLSGAAILAASTAIAQISDTPSFESEEACTLSVVPAEICAGNLPQVVIVNEGEITVLDNNFKEINRFSFDVQTGKQTNTFFTAIPILEVSYQNEEQIAAGTTFTFSTALTYLQENFGGISFKTEEHGSETWFIEYYWNDWQYGENFPQTFIILKSDGSLYRVVREYNGTPTGYTDTWIEEPNSTPETNDFTYGVSKNYLYINGFEVYSGITVSQKLFNDDDNYEYLVPVLTSGTRENFWGDCIDGKYQNKTVITGDFVTGVKLMNDKGAVLQTFDADGSYSNAYILGDNKYIAFDDKYYYRISGNGTGALTEVALPAGVKISPRVAQRSTPIDITVGDDTTTRTVKVIGTNGMVMMTTEIPAGITSTSINTSRLPAGMYVVTVDDGSNNVENCKIVIR